MRYLFLLGAIGHTFAFQSLLKECPNKHDHCNCPFVDYVYVINLDMRPEKFQRTLEEFEKVGVNPYRFSAVNGWELSLDQINQAGIEIKRVRSQFKRLTTKFLEDSNGKIVSEDGPARGPGKHFCHAMTPGAIGIVLSHLSILKNAYESGYNRIWVVEDDIQILEPLKKLAALIQEADERFYNNWDLLFTDDEAVDNQSAKKIKCTALGKRPDLFYNRARTKMIVKQHIISNTLKKLGNRYGAYSYIINRNGIAKVLKYYEKMGIFLPYDLEYANIPELVRLSSRQDLISHRPNSPSDTGEPNFQNNTEEF